MATGRDINKIWKDEQAHLWSLFNMSKERREQNEELLSTAKNQIAYLEKHLKILDELKKYEFMSEADFNSTVPRMRACLETHKSELDDLKKDGTLVSIKTPIFFSGNFVKLNTAKFHLVFFEIFFLFL